MVQVTSTKYPGLRVIDVGVKFVDGVAEVSDPAALEHLRSLADMGVVVPAEAEEQKRRPGRPKKSD